MAHLVSDDIWGVMTVWQEAQGEVFDGKTAVAEVILRHAHIGFSDPEKTVAGAVLHSWQFSGWNTVSPVRVRSAQLDDQDLVVQECMKAWERAKGGSNVSCGALLYYNPAVCTPSWEPHCCEVAVIGHHRFMVPK
jgi:spore germination cell wall hydrolase CwlJ-like protein